MPKMKTHRGAAKRFKKTGSGKLLREPRTDSTCSRPSLRRAPVG